MVEAPPKACTISNHPTTPLQMCKILWLNRRYKRHVQTSFHQVRKPSCIFRQSVLLSGDLLDIALHRVRPGSQIFDISQRRQASRSCSLCMAGEIPVLVRFGYQMKHTFKPLMLYSALLSIMSSRYCPCHTISEVGKRLNLFSLCNCMFVTQSR